MKLSERLDIALARRDLSDRLPPPPTPKPRPKPPIVPKTTPSATYQTVQEGLQNLSKHDTDEDGSGSFTAQNLGINDIHLPMVVDEYVIEDIQRTKTGIIQVQFRKH